MVRTLARWLALVAAALAAPGAPAQDPPATPVPAPAAAPADPSRGVEVGNAAPDPADALRAEALTLFGRADDDRTAAWVASGGGPDSRRIVSCPNLFGRIEVWTFLSHRLLGPNARLIFFPEPGTGVGRYWTLLDGETALLAAKSEATMPISELADGAFGCADAALVRDAVRSIRARQGDTAGGLRERAALAAPISGPSEPVPAAGPAPLVLGGKRLSGKEKKLALEALPERYQFFLRDVEPILTDVEETTFLRLGSDYQRDKFIEEFWKRRSVDSDGQRVRSRTSTNSASGS
jgi:hypothetical protein